VLGFLWFQFATFPRFDSLASARPLWLREHPSCAPPNSRDLQYGLFYYTGRQIPVCSGTEADETPGRVVH
jgi:hypothetical protein